MKKTPSALASARSSLPIKFSNLVSAFGTARQTGTSDPMQRGRLSALLAELPGIEPAAAQRFPSDLCHLHHYASAAALSLVITALIVAGNQRVLPRAVGIPSAINPSAIA
jgi:hypothetical protein